MIKLEKLPKTNQVQPKQITDENPKEQTEMQKHNNKEYNDDK